MNADGRKSNATGNNPVPIVQSIATVSLQVKGMLRLDQQEEELSSDHITEMTSRLYL